MGVRVGKDFLAKNKKAQKSGKALLDLTTSKLRTSGGSGLAQLVRAQGS